MMRPMEIQEHVPLANLTTMRVGGNARYFIRMRDPDQIPQALTFARERDKPFYVLGGGSNVIIGDTGLDGVVLKMDIPGMEVGDLGEDNVRLRAGAGEDWDALVARCVESGYWGIENMSLIPGTVGAVPIQNVGAYGQEASDTLAEVRAWDTVDHVWRSFANHECHFSYRSSLFNTTARDRYIITRVTFTLAKQGQPNLSHAAVRDALAGAAHPTLEDMRACVIALRTDGRLPDVSRVGNAGSFFKNVVLNKEEWARAKPLLQALAGSNPLRFFAMPEGVKLSTADLIRWCGLTEARVGHACLYPRNPLVIMNEDGKARATDVIELARYVIARVRDKTGINLMPEPRILGVGQVLL